MSAFMNDYDITFAVRRFTRASKPNRLALALVIANLQDATNEVSDGWAYWPKPCRAAAKAMTLVNSTTNAANDEQEATDATDAEVAAAIRPIKSFLTRHAGIYGPERRERILRAVTQ